jgi:hypothetical protein
VLFVSLEVAEDSSIFLFVVLNASYLAFNYGLLNDKPPVVLVCLWTNVVVLAALFVHVCNFVALLHVYVMDLMVWYDGWMRARSVYKTLDVCICQNT